MNEKILDGLSQQFSALINNLPKNAELPGQEHIKGLLQGAFAKMDLVTRDEFEAQSAVLARTRDKVEKLEKRMAELEDKFATADK